MKISLLITLCIAMFLTACSKDSDTSKMVENNKNEASAKVQLSNPEKSSMISNWDDLVPQGMTRKEVEAQFKDQLKDFKPHSKSVEAMQIYTKINKQLAMSPINKELDKKQVSLSGFVAPLQHYNGELLEFLLVPYFGACIHLPPPPMNQTVVVAADIGKGIRGAQLDKPVTVTGTLSIDGKETKTGNAGYRILDPKITFYSPDKDASS